MVESNLNAYLTAQSAHRRLPAFSPYIAADLLPYLALLLLGGTFTLAFYFSTLPKNASIMREVSIASTSSVFAGFGIVALFCSVGVYV